ncbi:MAG: hypothetical protein J6586_04365 [Snodgrassella sp.]|uniref:Uncharacterized protein n=1 Tax=Snodgrassella alvi TaxID=1196083 RepID=A0A2N9XL52_9NEIS|nr:MULTISPECIES: hypothetical protein [Snodgrassella]MCO6515725.1 hypothetical protein [Snodgrassella sp.]SCC14931.1 hypothetical protein GA0061082_1126 [Snodgrassella sp. R-53583]PIT12752.1 hypothetical protein BGI32_11265 [Snodgrassella alvi]PIT15661.1 hypothetical protein BGI33_05800 [Snodgrassella alvi]PIT18670.1 hypothetical protein BGI34_03765 [Snodgrassella alvi]
MLQFIANILEEILDIILSIFLLRKYREEKQLPQQPIEKDVYNHIIYYWIIPTLIAGIGVIIYIILTYFFHAQLKTVLCILLIYFSVSIYLYFKSEKWFDC